MGKKATRSDGGARASIPIPATASPAAAEGGAIITIIGHQRGKITNAAKVRGKMAMVTNIDTRKNPIAIVFAMMMKSTGTKRRSTIRNRKINPKKNRPQKNHSETKNRPSIRPSWLISEDQRGKSQRYSWIRKTITFRTMRIFGSISTVSLEYTSKTSPPPNRTTPLANLPNPITKESSRERTMMVHCRRTLWISVRGQSTSGNFAQIEWRNKIWTLFAPV
mmetsp:Transcript_37725/g.79540  ORF Transcript_37725/g.79540 Transcript_37725/m.79540 type:complete len:221 (+) Transcript_37725:367-1029(+)